MIGWLSGYLFTHFNTISQRARPLHGLAEPRVPEADEQHDSGQLGRVDYLVLEGVVEDEALALLPPPPLPAHADGTLARRRRRHQEAEVARQPHVGGCTVR